MEEDRERIEELESAFAENASNFNAWFQNVVMDSTIPMGSISLEETRAFENAYSEFMQASSICTPTLVKWQNVYFRVCKVDNKLPDACKPGSAKEICDLAYGLFEFRDALSPFATKFLELKDICCRVYKNNIHLISIWNASEEALRNLQHSVEEHFVELEKEIRSRMKNLEVGREFINSAGSFHKWLKKKRREIGNIGGSLEEQLSEMKQKNEEIRASKSELEEIKEKGAMLAKNLTIEESDVLVMTREMVQFREMLDGYSSRMAQILEEQIQSINQINYY